MKISAAFLALLVSGVSALAPLTLKPDAKAFAYGLPGALPPVSGGFDPFNFADKEWEIVKQYREAELQHGRVAMLGALGMLVTEEPIEFHPLFQADNKDIGPAIRHLDEVRAVSPFFFELLAFTIGILEFNRAVKGWTAPGDVLGTGRTLKPDYFPGDVGFDPLGLAPEDPDEFGTAHQGTPEWTFGHAWMGRNGRPRTCQRQGNLCQLGSRARYGFMSGFLFPLLVRAFGKGILTLIFSLSLYDTDRFDPSSLPVQF